MIITQTPLRISFAGGGTDFAGFYQEEEGCVISTAIDKYIFVIVKGRFDEKIRVGYSRTEMVDSVDEIEHELVREALKKVGIVSSIEIATMADVPSEGSGLGSSSSVTVGLLNALYAYKGESVSAERLAKEACEIEIDILGKPIGKQDQYIAAFGGLRFIRFNKDGSVDVESVHIDDDRRRQLEDSLILFYTGITRKASEVLFEQSENIPSRMEVLTAMRNQAYKMKDCILSNMPLSTVGEIMQDGWEKKKLLAGKISNSHIDELYSAALKGGATGGKLVGAGGGGFLLLYCPPGQQNELRKALPSLKELPFGMERDGSKVIFDGQKQREHCE